MTKREKINRNIGLTFDFLRQIVDKPEIIDKISTGSILEFVEKDFSTIEKGKGKSKRKYLKVISQLEGI
jgi:hypothetical protein